VKSRTGKLSIADPEEIEWPNLKREIWCRHSDVVGSLQKGRIRSLLGLMAASLPVPLIGGSAYTGEQRSQSVQSDRWPNA